jgi:hypothetical protein
MQIPMAIAALFQKALNVDRMHGVTDYSRWLSLISAGYFITDISIIFKHFNEHGPEPLIHAVICVVFFCYSAVKRRMQYFVPRLLMFEVSTPFVHMRWLLHKCLGKANSTLYKVNGIAMMAIFFACRIVYGSCAPRVLLLPADPVSTWLMMNICIIIRCYIHAADFIDRK